STHEESPDSRSRGVPETAMDDWVRARALIDPARKPLQFGQLQFHWGKPPPAADPSTRIFTERWALPACAGRRPRYSAIRHIHGDFHAKPQFDGLWCFPFHAEAPLLIASPCWPQCAVQGIGAIMKLVS